MFYDPSLFDFVAELEDNWHLIRQELTQLHEQDFIPWPEKYLYGKGWDAFGLYAFGVKLGKNCQLCPETTRLVNRIPGVVTAGFSSLTPGTHITPHTGYDEGLLRCHMGLTVPENCALRVGDETRTWQEGKCMVFDDTVEHEAWNRGDRTRVVLLLDFKAPKHLLKRGDTQPQDKPEQQSQPQPLSFNPLKWLKR